MISTINEAAVTLSRFVELSIFGKATIMLAIGLIVVKLAGRARASVRHLLLAATFATVLALPLITLTAPEVTIGVPVTRASESITAFPPAARSEAVTLPTNNSLSSRVTERASSSGVSWIAIVRLVWIAGAALMLLQLSIDLFRLRRIRRDGLPWTERRELMNSLATECGVSRSVEILLHEGILAPLTNGLWRPAILLPYEACEWSEADLRRAIIHELEHVRRGDWVIQLAARATCAFYWFHPLVWVAFRWLSLQAERACDDAVVRGAEHTEYAEQLVLLAGRLSKAQAQPALGMANRSDLSTRVSALLDNSQRRGRAGLLAATSALGVASLVVVVIAPVRAVTLPRKPAGETAQATGPQTRISQRRISSALDRALVEAAAEGDISDIDELLRTGANINCEFDGDGTPLIAAAREGRLDAVRLLLERGADPNLAARGDGNALIMAAREGHAGIVSLLLDRGASIDQIVPGDENPLICASGNGHLDVVKVLVARGADVNARAFAPVEIEATAETAEGVPGKSLSEREREPVISRNILRLKNSILVALDDHTSGEWRTPLSMARRSGHEAIVAFLLASGARE